MEENQNKKKIDKKIIIGIILAIVVLVAVFLLGRASNNTSSSGGSGLGNLKQKINNAGGNNGETQEENIDGNYYNLINLVDEQAGVVAFTGLIPEDWTASIKSDWNVISPDYPGLESVTLLSPDGSVSISIDSQQQFAETSDPLVSEGVNYDYYTTYLHYMDADEFVQYYMDYAFNGASLVKVFENDQDILSQAKQLQQMKINSSRENLGTIIGSNYGMSYNVTGANPTMSKKQYNLRR